MVQASVGFHCPDCARSGKQRVLRARDLVTRPIVTQVLIGINVAVFVLTASQGGGAAGLTTDGFNSLLRKLAVAGPLVAQGDWWRIVTSGFIHFGLLHLGFNMFALWILGSMVEPALGKVRFGMLYFTALLGGSLGALLLEPNTFAGGASGAIFGLMAAAIVGQRAQGWNIWQTGLGAWLVINLLITFTPGSGISIGGHLGGLVAGFICGWLFFILGPRRRDQVLPMVLCGALAAAIVAASLYVAANPLT
jgi:membrane associated rhomboid family serine protease